MGIKAYLGCGRQVLEGWANLDPQTSLDGRIEKWSWNDPLPFENGTSDVVLVQHSLQHCRPCDYDRNFTEIRRVLAPGGKLVVKEADSRYYVWHRPGAKDKDGIIASVTSLPEVVEVMQRNGFVDVVTDKHDIVARYGGDVINRTRRLLASHNLFVVEGTKPGGC